MRSLQSALPRNTDGVAIVVYLNHSSWWDPLVSLLLARRFFAMRNSYGPIEEKALQRYRFLARLGFFGVDAESFRGVANFLRAAENILASTASALWITPQGKFEDNRTRPLRFERGISHLANRLDRVAYLPLAIEYSFWEEPRPEVLLAFGDVLIFERNKPLCVRETTALLETALANVQDQLGSAARRRQVGDWCTLLEGRSGVAGVYDVWRRVRACFRGETFNAAHSEL